MIQQNITTLKYRNLSTPHIHQKGKKNLHLEQSLAKAYKLPKANTYSYRGWVTLISWGIPFLVRWNHLSLGYLFTVDTPVESNLGWCEILIVTKISHILIDFNGRILTEVRSSSPPVSIMPKELLPNRNRLPDRLNPKYA